ncbi:MAG: hypothetical protein JST59_03400, partial [Actinobacteria bacterium]|nr:hypothetical protein [Actinomycetota bacterium]
MSTNDITVPVPGTLSTLSRRARSAFASIAGISGLLALVAIFWVLEPDTFGTTENFKLIVSQASVAAILAAGLSVSLTAGAFDLSFGAVMAGGGVLVAGLLTNAGLGPAPAILLTVLAGVGFGAANGLLVAYGRLPSLIATLSTQSILTGVLVWATSSVSVNIDSDSSFNQIARGEWLGLPR